jgi:hypothetical protein
MAVGDGGSGGYKAPSYRLVVMELPTRRLIECACLSQLTVSVSRADSSSLALALQE